MSLAEPDKVAQTITSTGVDFDVRRRRSRTRAAPGRGKVVLRGLRIADITGLVVAYLAASLFFKDTPDGGRISEVAEFALFLATLPLWLVLANLYGLYNRDEMRADHSTADEVFGVVNLVTLGTWIVFALGWASGLVGPELSPVLSFWLFAIVGIVGGRALVRSFARGDEAYVQRALILGAGDVGQLVARKITQHPEYAIELVGFVDDDPRVARSDIEVNLLGGVRLYYTTIQHTT